MNLIFLDIDGVLQPHQAQERFKHNIEQLKQQFIAKNPKYAEINEYDIAAAYYDWDKNAIENIRYICNKYNAMIIITSNWRETYNLEKLRLIFAIHNLEQYIFDHTINFGISYRAYEIFNYIENTKNLDNFVIIDDVDYHFSEIFCEHFVKPDSAFLIQQLQLTENILNNQNYIDLQKLYNQLQFKIIWTGKAKIPQNYFLNGSILAIAQTNKGFILYRLQIDLNYVYGKYRQITNPQPDFKQIIQYAKKIDNLYCQNIFEYYNDINFVI